MLPECLDCVLWLIVVLLHERFHFLLVVGEFQHCRVVGDQLLWPISILLYQGMIDFVNMLVMVYL